MFYWILVVSNYSKNKKVKNDSTVIGSSQRSPVS